jgi:hypothetical protein
MDLLGWFVVAEDRGRHAAHAMLRAVPAM